MPPKSFALVCFEYFVSLFIAYTVLHQAMLAQLN
jgi:hypothetical protein